MVDDNEHISEDLPSTNNEPGPKDDGLDALKNPEGHDDALGLGNYVGRAGAGAERLARAVISRSVAAGNRVRRPIGTTLASLGGMLHSMTERGANGIGLFRGTLHSGHEAAGTPARVNGLDPSSIVWLQPVTPETDVVGPVSEPIRGDVISRRPGKLGGQSSTERTKGVSVGDSSGPHIQRRRESARNARPIGRAAATRIRRRPDTRSLRFLPTYVNNPATMKTERQIEGKLSRPVASRSKWAPTEYESTKDRPPVSLENFLERNIAPPKEHRLRPVSVSRRGHSKTEIPAGRTAAEHGAANVSSEDGGTTDAPNSTGLNQVSVIHRDVAEAAGPSDKPSEVLGGRPRIYQRSKQIISRGRDALLRRRKASSPMIEAGNERSAADRPGQTFGTAETGSSVEQSERISRSPLPDPLVGKKERGTRRVQNDPITATATPGDARNAGVSEREQPSAGASSSADADLANPRQKEVNVSSSNAVDVEADHDKARSIVNRSRELVFRKPSEEIRSATGSNEATLPAETIRRRPDGKANSDLERPGKTGTVLTRALEKLTRKPRAARPTASISDRQAPQETVRSAEIAKKPAEGPDERVAGFGRRSLDAGVKTLHPANPLEIDDVSPLDTSGGEPGFSGGNEDSTQTSLLSQPVLEHRADRHEPDHTAVAAEASGMGERAKKRETVRRASIKQDAETYDTVGGNASPTKREPENNDRPAPLMAQVTRAARGIKLGTQRLVFKSEQTPSTEGPEPAEEQPKASRTRVRAQPADAGDETAGPRAAMEGNPGRSTPELLHRQITHGPAESVRQVDTFGRVTPRSPLVRSHEGPVTESAVMPSAPQEKGDGKSGGPASRSRRGLNNPPQVQRRIQPVAADTRLQRATASTPTLKTKTGQSSGGLGPEATTAEIDAVRNGAAPEGLGRKLGALVHKRESHGVASDEAPRAGSAQPSRVSQAAHAGVPAVQRSSSGKEPVSSHNGVVHRSPIARAPASASSGTPSREPATPAQTAEVDLDERDEPLYKKFTPADIEFLSSKMFTYIKRKLNDDRERHGHPGFSMWS